MTLFPESFSTASLRIIGNRTDNPATVPGYRARLSDEARLPPETDQTDIEHDAAIAAHARFTRLEHLNLEKRP